MGCDNVVRVCGAYMVTGVHNLCLIIKIKSQHMCRGWLSPFNGNHVMGSGQLWPYEVFPTKPKNYKMGGVGNETTQSCTNHTNSKTWMYYSN